MFEHIAISVGYIWQGNFNNYFGLDCLKRFARDLLEKETGKNIKRKEKMIFNKKDKIYLEANNTCHLCSKTCFTKKDITVMKLVNIGDQHKNV